MVVGKIQLLEADWTESLGSLLPVSWRPSSVLCHVGLSTGYSMAWHHLLDSIKASKWESKKGMQHRSLNDKDSLLDLTLVRFS